MKILTHRFNFRYKKFMTNCICSKLGLKNLSGCPRYIVSDFDCSYNKLITLEDGPTTVLGKYICSFNERLEDISSLPHDITDVYIEGCNKITVFPDRDYDDEELTFHIDSDVIKQRIKSWPTYSVIKETEKELTIKVKFDNEIYMDSL